jgi:hypothetical protein
MGVALLASFYSGVLAGASYSEIHRRSSLSFLKPPATARRSELAAGAYARGAGRVSLSNSSPSSPPPPPLSLPRLTIES